MRVIQELPETQDMGITHFRLSPHSHDMAQISQLFRDVLDGRSEAGEVSRLLHELAPEIPFSNGFYYNEKGYSWKRV